MEFDALQSEVDRITETTQFTTKNIFSQHQPQYYQMEGNVHWQQGQRHAVNVPDNTLTVTYVQEAGGAEKQKTIQVPEGVYTTQELIDEIDGSCSVYRWSCCEMDEQMFDKAKEMCYTYYIRW